ncbi:Dihydroxyacetone kinase [Neolecta irregularis DAH-3]|uniref:Dihydroxyacetone kinase n=1 Tax=Neolecta irregularis (strain DAH-3) TaxID=1198029 RepID=A0A1U7LHU9_NEOID|nr:Dihydroxyacetone kinase [Neolecta irregularis DAH-3]|eukprot:OLL22227.1 Dihydroxyacetone kinase [Neolecta irregularis DAH-3]
MGASLDHTFVPNRSPNFDDDQGDEIYYGMEIHNENGNQKVYPIPSTSELARHLLRCLFDPQDIERAYVLFEPNHYVVLMINNLGDLSNLELLSFASVVNEQIQEDYDINPLRVYVGTFMTSLSGKGASITVLNISKTILGDEKVLKLLDKPVSAPVWSMSIDWKCKGVVIAKEQDCQTKWQSSGLKASGSIHF